MLHHPDPLVRQEALATIGMGCRERLLAWDRDLKAPAKERMEGVEVERVFLSSRHGRGLMHILFYATLDVKMLWRGMLTSFDVVHCHDLDTLLLGFGKTKHEPIVYDTHDSFPDMLDGSVHRLLQWGLKLENLLIRRIDLLITVGEKLRKHFQERGAPHSVVVGNWKRLQDFSRIDRDARQAMATKVHRFRRAVTNWENGEKARYREYSAFMPVGYVRRPNSADQTHLELPHQVEGQ
jgi:hypothetical protein